MNNYNSKDTEKYAEIYISVDIEATGPIPGEYSMSSLGAFVAGAKTNKGYIHFDNVPENVFYQELAPITDNFVPEAIKVGLLEGFDKEKEDETGKLRLQWMKDHGEDPMVSMQNFANFVKDASAKYDAKPVFMAYPASFDWTFVYWYFQKFEVDSPFGFSNVLDLKTAFSIKSNNPIRKSTKRYMPKSLFSDLPHTHRADDDAIEQGILGINILNYIKSN